MEYKKLLFEQIKIAYPNAIFDVEKKMISLSINGFGVISFYGDINLSVEYGSFSIIEDEHVKTYIKPRLKFENVDIYFNKRKIMLYDREKYTTDSVGSFKKAMRIFSMFNTIVKEVNNLLDALNG